jgi:molybdate transport system substrate-binding protein
MLRAGALILLAASACLARTETIYVAAAISLRESLMEIAKAHEAESPDRISLTFGSSGQIMAQVKAGAPIDIFISAASKQLDELSSAGLVDDATRRVVAQNQLVLVVPADAKGGPTSVADLASDAVKKLAIGEPKTVPAGQYAEQVLTSLKIADKLRGRLVYGSNVRQVLDYVERGEVSAAFVYLTDAKEAGDKVRVIAAIDASLHEPIDYPAAVVKASTKPASARAFLDFLDTEQARSIFAKRGFVTGEGPPQPREAPSR